jgi:perosamine synthetase
MTPITVPLARPDLSEHELEAAARSVREGWLSWRAPWIEELEERFAALCEVPHAVAVSSGTAALHATLMALGVRAGDEVLVPAFTFVAVAAAVRHAGATPVFVDSEPGTWCIDPLLVEAAVTPRTRGVVLVHQHGHPADVDRVNAFAARRGLWVVEDCAEAHFARHRGRAVGGLCRAGVFSFFANKLISGGEGGAITTADPELAARVRQCANMGATRDQPYDFALLGHSFRMTGLSAAVLCAQLDRLEQIRARRAEVFARYDARFEQAPAVERRRCQPWAEPAPWLYSVLLPDRPHRDAAVSALRRNGIEGRPFFKLLSELPPYRDAGGAADFPCARRLAETGLSLPTFGGLPQDEIDRVASIVAEVAARPPGEPA